MLSPASRYSPDMSQHAMLGSKVKDHYTDKLNIWKD